LPWWLKISAKIVLSRLPFGYRFWQRLSLFRHGAMDDPEYVLRNFKQHYEAAGRPGSGQAFTALELGPGDSLASALVVSGLGGGSCWLVDAGDFARKDIDIYRDISANLRDWGVLAPDLAGVGDTQTMLAQCQARYLINGLDGLRTIADSSVDFIWSQAVLEHVRKDEFADTMRELRRVLKPHGACSHRVDLRDHLDAGLNNLRFTDRLWESQFFAASGFYTNRIGYAEMLADFKAAGFAVEIGPVDRWSAPPLARRAMAEQFRHRSEDDLMVSGFNVVLRPANSVPNKSVTDHAQLRN
jgi:SAM-dependent methyltransferase